LKIQIPTIAGSSQNTLQDIKVPSYGGGYVYKTKSTAATNRFLYW